MKLRSIVAAAGLVLAACGGPSVAASVTEIPMERDANGHLRVPVAVADAGTFDFILHTAASRTAVMRPLVDELGWQPLEGQSANLNGSSGHTTIEMFEPVTLRIGGDVEFVPDLLPGLNALDIPGEPFYGILGSNFFETYAVEIDAPGERLRFSDDGAAPLLGDQAARFATADVSPLVEGIWMLEVMIGDVPVTALLDTGARGSMLNRAAAEALGITLPDTAAPETISGASGHQMGGIGLQLDSISVGDRVWRNKQVLVSDLHVFDVLDIQDVPAMVLASDLLLDGRLVVDYAAGRLFVENVD